MQKLVEVSGEDLDMFECSWEPCLPILSNYIAAKTKETFEKINCLYGISEGDLKAKFVSYQMLPYSEYQYTVRQSPKR